MHFAPMDRRGTRRGLLKTSLGMAAAAPSISSPLQATPATPATDGENDQFAELDDLIASRMPEFGIPGAAVGVIAGEQEHTAAFGVTSIEHPVPVDPDTLFQIGSTTKTFTGTAIMRLVEAGELDLDATVQSYLPDFQVADANVSREARLWHLLTHTGGWLDGGDPQTGRGDDALSRFVAQSAEMPQIAPPGQYFSYSNLGLATAGRVIEAVTGQAYEPAIRELLLEPAGLNDTSFFPEDFLSRSFAVGHTALSGEPEIVEPWGLPRAMNPAGGLVASVNNELRYARFHLGDGTIDGSRLLSAESMELMQAPHGPGGTVPSIAGPFEAIGVTWHIMSRGGERIVLHHGGTLGQHSTFVLAPDRQFAITVLTNADTGVAFGNAITDWALERFLAVPAEPLESVPADPALVDAYAGTYELPDGSETVKIADEGGDLELTWLAAGQPEVVVPVHLAEDGWGWVEYAGLTAPVELVRDETGEVAWLRFVGRLMPRTS